MTTPAPKVRVAAMSDIHCGKTSQGTLAPVLAQAVEHADVLVLCGDLTDYGLAEEARVLVKELAAVHVPIVAVLGNHDFESGEEGAVTDILTAAGVQMLDGGSCEVMGVGFAGTKGFAGGFGRGTLGAWGEATVKNFVNEAVHEALKLETALARLRNVPRIAMLHYAPVRDTVVGEPLEIFPFLGCGRLEEPLARYPAVAVVHGHAHNGCEEGKTSHGTPVYNVAMPLLKKNAPDRPPVRIIEVDTGAPETTPLATTPYTGPERRSSAPPTR
jgi:Icc-related predicted phosphoesterase